MIDRVVDVAGQGKQTSACFAGVESIAFHRQGVINFIFGTRQQTIGSYD